MIFVSRLAVLWYDLTTPAMSCAPIISTILHIDQAL